MIAAVIIAICTGVVGDAIWDGLKRLAASHVASTPTPTPTPHFHFAAIFQLLYFILIALIGVFIGKYLESLKAIVPALRRPKIQQSKIFVMEVEGRQPLNSKNSDWKFFLTNCSTRILRRVELYNIKSEIGAYLLGFQEIPVMQPGQRVELRHTVFPQRLYGPRAATLWDFAQDVAGATATTFFWYDIYIEYREAGDDSAHDGGFVAVCFDLQSKILKTEGAEYHRENRLGL
jgi:hypothetical protein